MAIIYLHIGIHKTGTTSIQQFLFDHQEDLKNKGFLYPSAGRTNKNPTGHHNLAWALLFGHPYRKNYDPNAGDWDELIAEIDLLKPDNIIITSEDFSLLNLMPETIFVIRDYLSRYDVKIVIYLRNQVDYFKSAYSQAIKSRGYSESFQKFLTEERLQGNYYSRLEPWREIFGKENIIIGIYDNLKLENDLINHFLKSINFPEKDIELKARSKNITPSTKVIKIMRLLNIITEKGLKMSPNKCRELYLNKMANLNGKLSQILSKIPDFILNPELLAKPEEMSLIEEFKASNQKIAQEYLGWQDKRLFNPGSS